MSMRGISVNILEELAVKLNFTYELMNSNYILSYPIIILLVTTQSILWIPTLRYVVHNVEKSGNRTTYSFWDDFNVTVRNIQFENVVLTLFVRWTHFFYYYFILFSQMDDEIKATFQLPTDILELLTENLVRNHIWSRQRDFIVILFDRLNFICGLIENWLIHEAHESDAFLACNVRILFVSHKKCIFNIDNDFS